MGQYLGNGAASPREPNDDGRSSPEALSCRGPQFFKRSAGSDHGLQLIGNRRENSFGFDQAIGDSRPSISRDHRTS